MLGGTGAAGERVLGMIIGLGIDRTDMRYVEAKMAIFEARLSPAEKSACRFKAGYVACVARKHAAKEAVMKALGANDAFGNVAFPDVELSNSPSGRPIVTLKGSALRQLESITPNGHASSVHISITDDVPVAEAICIIEATARAG
jgi:holo-[acyl-carrier protein] synthase